MIKPWQVRFPRLRELYFRGMMVNLENGAWHYAAARPTPYTWLERIVLACRVLIGEQVIARPATGELEQLWGYLGGESTLKSAQGGKK